MADITYWGLTSTKGTVTIADTSTATIEDLIAAVAADEGLDTNYYQLSKSTDPSNTLSSVVGDSTLPPTLDALGIGDGDTVYCTTNQTGSKEERQIQKLDIAAAKRGDTYDITQLPTKYSGNDVVDNPNSGGLLENRPWAAVLDIVRTNLQLYLEPTAYSGTGTSWTDSSTNSYTTTLVGAPTWDVTRFVYTGSSAQYINVGQSLGYETFSIGCWFQTSGTGIKMLMSKETTAGNPWNYRIWLNSGQINFDMSQVTTQSALQSPLTTYNDNNWHYVIATRDDSNWYLYVDGAQVNTKADPYTGTVINSQVLWIGRSAFTQGGVSPTGSYQFTGSLGEIFVYNDVLTASEVLQNYNATRATYGL